MDVVSLGREQIDVCRACGGLFVDWFDGPLAQVISTFHQQQLDTAPAVGPAISGGMCPRCNVRMTESTLDGATIHQCSECLAAFVPRLSFDGIVHHASANSDDAREKEHSAWERLVNVLREAIAAVRNADPP